MKIDKYKYYQLAVQAPDDDIKFITKTFRKLCGRDAQSWREDFCGTFANTCAFVDSRDDRYGVGIDLDPEPIAWGQRHNLTNLGHDAQKRIKIFRANVLNAPVKPTDIVCALNFSYFIFKTRAELKNYFAKSLKHLKKRGAFFLDCVGGSQYHAPFQEKRRADGFMYHWEQKSFDPLTSYGRFSIHFSNPKMGFKKDVFTYDWRLWSIPEIRDLLYEMGFKKVFVYWEGSNQDGTGNGIFSLRKKGEACPAWIAYIVALNN